MQDVDLKIVVTIAESSHRGVKDEKYLLEQLDLAPHSGQRAPKPTSSNSNYEWQARNRIAVSQRRSMTRS